MPPPDAGVPAASMSYLSSSVLIKVHPYGVRFRAKLSPQALGRSNRSIARAARSSAHFQCDHWKCAAGQIGDEAQRAVARLKCETRLIRPAAIFAPRARHRAIAESPADRSSGPLADSRSGLFQRPRSDFSSEWRGGSAASREATGQSALRRLHWTQGPLDSFAHALAGFPF